jgi:hypothetical protein
MRRPRDASNSAVVEYKQVLKAVLDARPSGMRQRLAMAIGKNRSFVSQISNPAYQVAIPARHVGLIFDICHFSAPQRAAFLKAYSRAHPGRLAVATETRHERKITLALPDLGNDIRNQQLETLIYDFVHRLALLLDEAGEGTRKARHEEVRERS